MFIPLLMVMIGPGTKPLYYHFVPEHNPVPSMMTNVNYMYDPETHHWTVKAPMPTERGALSATVIDDKIYVIGGALRRIFPIQVTRASSTLAHTAPDSLSASTVIVRNL